MELKEKEKHFGNSLHLEAVSVKTGLVAKTTSRPATEAETSELEHHVVCDGEGTLL